MMFLIKDKDSQCRGGSPPAPHHRPPEKMFRNVKTLGPESLLLGIYHRYSKPQNSLQIKKHKEAPLETKMLETASARGGPAGKAW